MRRFIAAAILLLGFVLTPAVVAQTAPAAPLFQYSCAAHPSGLLYGDNAAPMCAAHWEFIGTCQGINNDIEAAWTEINGTTSPPPPVVPPWENQWIKIVKTEITMLPASGQPPPLVYYGYIGNSSYPDQMGWIGYNEVHSKADNLSYDFVPASRASASDYFDLHFYCNSGPVRVAATIYYIVPVSAYVPPPPPPPPLCTTFDSLNPSDHASGITLSNSNLTATSDGASVHELARAITGIAPNTLRVHYEWTISGMAGTPIDVFGLQDGSVPTNTQIGTNGTGFGVGYSNANGHTYASNFTPPGSSSTAIPNGAYAMDYDSVAGTATITGPGGYSVSRTMSGTPLTMFPAVSMEGPAAGNVTFNFGASNFVYPVPSGFQAGLCQ